MIRVFVSNKNGVDVFERGVAFAITARIDKDAGVVLFDKEARMAEFGDEHIDAKRRDALLCVFTEIG